MNDTLSAVKQYNANLPVRNRAITPSRPNGLPSPETIARYSKLIPQAPLSKDNLSLNYAAVSMRKKREEARTRSGQPGDTVTFRWGHLNRRKAGTLIKVSADALTATIESGKNRTRFIVKTSAIQKA